MAIDRDSSEYGGQTVTGAAWVNLNEDVIADAKDKFKKLASILHRVDAELL